MTAFSDVLSALAPTGEGTCRVEVPESWHQGRTAYGGLTAGLGLEAALRAYPDLPPLRSAHVTFIAPAEGPLDVEVSVLRRGRSVSYVQADLHSAKGLATRNLFCFGASRPSQLRSPSYPAPEAPAPDGLPSFIPDASLAVPSKMPGFVLYDGVPRPAFTQNFDTRLVRGSPPASGAEEPDYLVWVRHRDRSVGASLVGLFALADMLPPAMLSTLESFVPVSSMTWHVNVLDIDGLAATSAEDDWRLLLSEAEHAHEGYSSQNMVVWDRGGRPLLMSRQSITIFG